MVTDSTVFLCGFFTAPEPFTGTKCPSGWTRIENDPHGIEMMRNYYYSEFVQFFTDDVTVFKRKIGANATICLKGDDAPDRKFPVYVAETALYQMPLNLIVFSIRLEIRETEQNDLAKVLLKLRSCSHYLVEEVGDFINLGVAPVFNAYKECGGKGDIRKEEAEYDFSFLVEFGNKLKIFQVSLVERLPDTDRALKNCIFCLNTLTEYDNCLSADTEEEYIDSAMAEGYLSVFKNWKLLALLDSVVILAHDPQPVHLSIWTGTYFEKIYVYELFRKCFLYKLNYNFHDASSNPRELQDEMKSFERSYSFANISYNFLPQLVDRAFVHALDFKPEEIAINQMINREVVFRDEKRENRTNHLLIVLAALAGFSAIWDLLSLIQASKDIKLWHVLLAFAAIAILVGAVFCFIRFQKKD